MKRISGEELISLATILGFQIQKECGGFRVVKAHNNIFPSDGICPTTTKRNCWIFLQGVQWRRKR